MSLKLPAVGDSLLVNLVGYEARLSRERHVSDVVHRVVRKSKSGTVLNNLCLARRTHRIHENRIVRSRLPNCSKLPVLRASNPSRSLETIWCSIELSLSLESRDSSELAAATEILG
jgi:hypothetical protein